jgi:hypothetical protein
MPLWSSLVSSRPQNASQGRIIRDVKEEKRETFFQQGIVLKKATGTREFMASVSRPRRLLWLTYPEKEHGLL